MKTALVMIVKNEERDLPRSLASVHDVVDVMIVVDTGSNDSTRDIAMDNGAMLLHHDWKDDFSEARNVGMKVAEEMGMDLVLQLDADEELNCTKRYFKKIVKHMEGIGGNMTLRNPNGGVIELLRLFPATMRYQYPIHEHISIPMKDQCFLDMEIHHFGAGTDSAADHQERRMRNLRILNKALVDDPQNSFLLAKAGEECMLSEAWQQACDLYMAAESQLDFNDNKKAWVVEMRRNNLGCLHEAGHTEQAEKLYRLMRGLYPQFTDVLLIHGSSTGDKNMLETAVRMGDPPDTYPTLGQIPARALSVLKQMKDNEDNPMSGFKFDTVTVASNTT